MKIKRSLVSVIIINYKTPKLTVECVESILQFTQWIDFEIIVVDNWSWPESRQYFDKHMSQDNRVIIIHSLNNLGFGWGNNLGYANSRGEYLFFLNSDTILFEDSLTILYQEYIKLSKIMHLWILGPRLYLNNNKTKIQIAGTQKPKLGNVLVSTIPFLKNIFKRFYYKFLETDNRDRNSSKIQWTICGAAMFCSKRCFEIIWYFDEQFFLYMEENDLSIRLSKYWYSSYYTVQTSIVHLENQSPKLKYKKLLIALNSLVKFIWKYRVELFFGYD